MNPIEHVWDALGRRVAGCQPPPQSLQELERALLEEWDRIPQLVFKARAMETADRERLRKANYDILQNSKEERVKKRHKKCTLEDTLAEERKNPSYEAVNGDRYRAMITNFFIPEFNNHDVQELWFQQDCATCHTARATIDLLKDTFGDRLISRFGPVNWPPRSCDLTPLDYFLWGYVKSLVYADKPQTLHHLEDNIRRVIADIRPQMLEKVIENWTSRLDYIRTSRGSPMQEIIFKICQVIYSQFGLAIHQNVHQARRRFVEWAQNEIAVVPDFHKRILLSDEAHFWLNGYVNKQKCRIWSEANPQVYVETPLHPEKLTVWCGLWAGGIIGPYFFKNDEGHNVTVNGDRYRSMITNFFIPELNNHDVQELWFQQDGATCHTARATIDLFVDDNISFYDIPANLAYAYLKDHPVGRAQDWVEILICMSYGAVGSLVVRVSDSRPEGLDSMPPNTVRVHTENALVKLLVRKPCGLNHGCRGLENISLPSSSISKLWRWR
ncbi:uncharacterized protein TNCV_677581 [Trichonephila clavipes]|nr:uncharacterized protein TNCV_677581 [Trichonephila clavipes]